MTSKHSQENPDNSMYSQLDFHVKICPLQANSEVSEKAQDQDCSMKLSGYLGKFNLDLSYLKTLEIYSLTKRGKPSKKSSFKLPKQGMMLNGQLFQQKIWERVTSESVSGLLPTPSQRDYKGGSGTVKEKDGKYYRQSNTTGIKYGVRLDALMEYKARNEMLPTPRANPAMSQNLNLPSIKNHTNPNLETVIANLPTPDLLPTPTAMDHLPQRGYESMKKQAEVHRKGRKKLANLREAVNPQTVELFNKLQNANGNIEEIHSTQTGNDIYLNPHFVEEMMGYPIGWLV